MHIADFLIVQILLIDLAAMAAMIAGLDYLPAMIICQPWLMPAMITCQP
jgi:hypothetical protein